jgi:hypothetical protein
VPDERLLTEYQVSELAEGGWSVFRQVGPDDGDLKGDLNLGVVSTLEAAFELIRKDWGAK